jgi:hypothetical protein
MKIVDLIQLLNNRLREFKLSRDYARMSGDLARMNTADEEILTLEDTLFQLNLLADNSKSAAVKEAILAEIITDGSIAVLDEYDITSYATDPKHEEKIMNILSKMGVMDTVEKIDDYISGKYWSSPVTGEMIMSAALAYTVDARLMMAIMEQDSRFGTVGVAVGTLNPGNVGNDDSGNTRHYESWQEGVTAVAEWLNRHRGSTIISEIPEETVLEPASPAVAEGVGVAATSTPITATSTTTTVITIPATATSTPATATTTPVTATSTPATEPEPQPEDEQPSAETPEPTTATSTPATTNQDSTSSSGTGQAATTTPASPAIAEGVGVVTATSTPETIPITTSTTTTTTASSSEETATTTDD